MGDLQNNNGNSRAEKRDNRCLSACVYLLFFVLMMITVSNKAYYYGDEFFSYLSANNYTSSAVEKTANKTITNFKMYDPGVLITPAKNCADYMLSFPYFGHIDIGAVAENQARDTHPPLYYILLHTICSFFPGVFSKWFTAAINILFALLTLFALRKLIRCFTDDEFVLNAISFVFILSSTVLNSVACFRMYIMAMFWITLYAYVLIRYVRKNFNWHFYAGIFAVIVCGTLTHYYCALYFILSGALFAAFILYDRKYKECLLCCATAVSAFAVSYMLFPAMMFHIFHSMRGADAINNISGTDYLAVRLQMAFGFINNQLFGYSFLLFIILAVWLCVRNKRLKNCTENTKNDTRQYCLLFLPAFAFVLIIAKIMPLNFEDENIRYFMPIFALLLISLPLYVFVKLKENLSAKSAIWTIFALCLFVTAGSWISTDWNRCWLYRGYLNDDYTKTFDDADCIHIGGVHYPHFFELNRYKSLVRFDTIDSAAKSQLFQSLMKNGKVVIGVLWHDPLAAGVADNVVSALLQSTGTQQQYSVVKLPYFYDTLYPGTGGYGNIYYITRNIR